MRLLLTGRQVEITPTLRRLVDARTRQARAQVRRRARLGAVRAFEGKKSLRGRADRPRTPGSHPARARRDRDVGHVTDRRGSEGDSAGRQAQRQVAGSQAVRGIGSDLAARRSPYVLRDRGAGHDLVRGMTQLPGVTVGRPFESRPETLGFDLEILPGVGDRRINSPCVHRIGNALAAWFDWGEER